MLILDCIFHSEVNYVSCPSVLNYVRCCKNGMRGYNFWKAFWIY